MKNHIILLMLLPIFLGAQGNLQFNRVILLTNGSQTVPNGKVWKMESALPAQRSMQDSAYAVMINGQPVYVSDFSSGDRYWDNISSITWETRKNGGASCSYSGTEYMVFEVSGYEKNLPFAQETYRWQYSPNTYPTGWTTMYTITPQNPANTLSIFNMRFGGPYSVRIPDNVEFRMTVNYRDGTTQQRTYGPYSYSCCGCGGGSQVYFIGTTNGPFEFPATQKDYYFISNPFPTWLPEGTTVAAGANLRYVSIIEFNIVP